MTSSKFFDDSIIFKVCDQVILIPYILKMKHIKFHGLSMKRTGFIVIFLLWEKKLPPPSPQLTLDRVNPRKFEKKHDDDWRLLHYYVTSYIWFISFLRLQISK